MMNAANIVVRLMLALLSCCNDARVLGAIRCHGDGPSLLNMTTPFIERSNGMWNPSL
jgi:hypothetical protein